VQEPLGGHAAPTCGLAVAVMELIWLKEEQGGLRGPLKGQWWLRRAMQGCGGPSRGSGGCGTQCTPRGSGGQHTSRAASAARS
jgi:hypothetical protein